MQRAVAHRGIAPAGREQREALLEGVTHAAEPKHKHAGCGHLQRERDAIQTPADLAQQRQLRGAALEPVVGGACALDEQCHRALMQIERVTVQWQCQRIDALHALALHARCLLAGHQQMLRRRRLQQLRHQRRNVVDQVLGVVQHEHPARERAQQCGPGIAIGQRDVERTRQRGKHLAALRERRQVHP